MAVTLNTTVAGGSGGSGGSVDPNTAIWTDSRGAALYKPDGVTEVAVGAYLGEYLWENRPDPATVDPYSRFFAADENLWQEYVVHSAGTAWVPIVGATLARTALEGPSTYKAWRLALGKAMLGISDARIILVGDSTNVGLTTSAGGAYNRTHVVSMAKVLNGAGFPVNFNSAFGTPNRAGGTSFTTWDSRWTTTGTAWATLSGFSSVGGEALGNSTTTATLKFTPTNPLTGAAYAFDSYDVYSCKNTGYATWTTDIGGAALATVNDNTTRGLRVSTVSTGGAAATGFINLQRNGTGGQAYILGFAPRVAATKHLEIFNVSAGSYATADWISGGTGATDFLARRVVEQMCAAVPSLVIVDIGINDWRTLTYSSTYQTNLETMVDGYIANGASVVLCKPVPSQIGYSAFITQANMDAYRAAIDTVANARGLYVYDKAARFESYTVGNAAGWYSDGLHPTQGAYAQMGVDLAQLVMGL